MESVALALAILMGASLGFMGGGGSILTVPILVYVAGYEPKTAIAMSLAVVGATSFLGAAQHWRSGNVHPPTAALFGLVAMAGSFTGAQLAGLISGQAQLVLFGIVMLIASGSMFRGRTEDGWAEKRSATTQYLVVALSGLGVGILTGVVGVGGGFLIVPALFFFAGLSMHRAVGTSLLVIVMNTASGFAGYLRQGVPVDWPFMLIFTAIAMLGITAGTRMSGKVRQATLRKAFAVFLIVMALWILWQNRGAVI